MCSALEIVPIVARQSAFTRRTQGDRLLLRISASGNFGLEPVDAFRAVKPEILGISPDETDGVGAPWQRLETALFDRLEIIAADLQLFGDVREFLASFLAEVTKVLADGFERRVGVARNLAQM